VLVNKDSQTNGRTNKMYIPKKRGDFNFSGAKFYRKTTTLPKANVRKVTAKFENIGTIIGDSVETLNVARADLGDYVIVGLQGEQYVNRASQYASLWEENPIDPTQLRSKNCGWAIPLLVDTEIEPPWGGIQRVAKGGVAFLRYETREMYLIEKKAFEVYTESD
jgi:hypothetical protein